MNKILTSILILLGLSLPVFAMETEELIRQTIDVNNLPEIYQNIDYDYSSTNRVEVKIQLDGEKISTKKGNAHEGQQVQFRVKRDVKYKGKTIIPKFTIVTGTIQTFITKGMNGIPASIIIDNIKIEGKDNTKVKGTIIKKGVNLSLLVFPLKWALTILPPTGSLTNFITGGNATIDKKTNLTIYYYPNWGKTKI